MRLSAEQEARIEAGVNDCLMQCRATDRPFTRVSAFLAELQENPDWTEREVIELQTRVIRVLLYRNGRPGAGDAPAAS